MSHALFNTLFLIVLAVAGYVLTYRFYPRFSRLTKIVIVIASSLVMCLWLLHHFAVFQMTDIIGLIRFLSRVRMEYTAFFVGVFSAVGQLWINHHRKKSQGPFTRHNGLVLSVFMMIPVYIYPIIYPVEVELANNWEDGVCIQSSVASCGPCCAATILNYYGIRKSEKEVGPEVFLSKMGSDIWHLVRYIKDQGLNAKVIGVDEKPEDVPTPCIAMVEQEGAMGFYHCIVIFRKTDSMYEFGDPGAGRFTWPESAMLSQYRFLGYVIHVTEPDVTD